MITISHVVALSNNNVIGVDNNLPWNLKTDLAHFRDYTTNKIIVMGRKTFESIGRPLPNRKNLIVSNTLNEINGAYIYKSTEEAIKNAKEMCINNEIYNEIVIIGGGYLFRDTLKITNKLILSEVDCEIDGDVFYPKINLEEWNEVSSKKFIKDSDNDFNFVVKVYERL
jgi:dihydrofolate reductase